MIDDLIQDAATRMDKSVESTHGELNSIRTGRASAALLDRVQVDYYGAITPLKQLSNISASEARLLTVTPYDKSSISSSSRPSLMSSKPRFPLARRTLSGRCCARRPC